MEKFIKRDPDYLIDTNGNVYSLKSGSKRKLKPTYFPKRGYVVYLGKRGFSVQLLMAETFLDRPSDCDKVGHKDGNHKNNILENIYWTSEKREHLNRIESALKLMPESNDQEKRICDIEGYEDFQGYTVTTGGRVYSFIDGSRRELSPSINDGYKQVILGSRLSRRITRKIHRLVAEAFIPKIKGKPQVNHIDGDKRNNDVSNLEWVSNLENQHHAIIHKLKDCRRVAVYDLEGNLIKTFPSLVFARQYFGIKHHSLVQYALNGKYKQAYGYIWKYID